MEFYPRRPYGLEAMAPEIVMELHFALSEATNEAGVDPAKTHELGEAYDTFYRELRQLPYHSPDQAEAILAAYAKSSDRLHRNTAACDVVNLTKVRPEAGLMIWAQLLRDEDEGVRRTALISLIQDAWDDEQLRELTLNELGPLIVALVDGLKENQEWDGRAGSRALRKPSRDSSAS
jgi:hypothetical protein